MTDLTVRETAARAIYETEPLPGLRTWDALVAESDEWPDGLARVETKRRHEQADAALAAVAAHDGLAEVLRRHRPIAAGDNVHESWVECSGCDETAADIERFIAAHLVDVVRAWIKGQG